MKSLEELNAIKDMYKNNVTIRTDEKDIRIVIGMGNSGLVAGARDIMNEIVNQVDQKQLGGKVLIMQEAKASISGNNPVVRIYDRENELAVYANVTREMVTRIIDEHIMNGNIVQEFLYTDSEV